MEPKPDGDTTGRTMRRQEGDEAGKMINSEFVVDLSSVRLLPIMGATCAARRSAAKGR
ncbi:MAG: hypothetical protein MZU79_07420 [Anaerotruncus sp.]|nr:hypothetical protein [Anaerotruncus sp.]